MTMRIPGTGFEKLYTGSKFAHELRPKLKLAVLRVISRALAGKKGRIIQYPFHLFRITHNLSTVALMMKIFLNLGTWTDIGPTPVSRRWYQGRIMLGILLRRFPGAIPNLVASSPAVSELYWGEKALHVCMKIANLAGASTRA
jgi:hypothetical protein